METLQFTVPQKLHSYRLDMALVSLASGLSRRKIRQIIDVGGCYQNKKRVKIASRPVHQGDRLLLQFSERGLKLFKTAQPALSAHHILRREGGVIAINKPPGLPIQATKEQSQLHLISALSKYLRQTDKTENRATELYLAHRLDRETSGVVLVAESQLVCDRLMAGFREREFIKEYHALVVGIPRENEFTVKCGLRKNGQYCTVHVAKKGGKDSETHFQVIKCYPQWGISLVACRPVTGRTHQIRVHLASKGLPILGDKAYGERPKSLAKDLLALVHYHQLHARQITHPDLPFLKGLIAPYPPSFSALLKLVDP